MSRLESSDGKLQILKANGLGTARPRLQQIMLLSALQLLVGALLVDLLPSLVVMPAVPMFPLVTPLLLILKTSSVGSFRGSFLLLKLANAPTKALFVLSGNPFPCPFPAVNDVLQLPSLPRPMPRETPRASARARAKARVL